MLTTAQAERLLLWHFYIYKVAGQTPSDNGNGNFELCRNDHDTGWPGNHRTQRLPPTI